MISCPICGPFLGPYLEGHGDLASGASWDSYMASRGY